LLYFNLFKSRFENVWVAEPQTDDKCEQRNGYNV